MKIHRKIKAFSDAIKNILFPIRCINCSQFVDTKGICNSCWKQITWISDPKCKICGTPFDTDIYDICPSCLAHKPHFDQAMAVFEYNDASRNIVLGFKHNDRTYLAKQAAGWLWRSCDQHLHSVDLIIPVPIFFWKRLVRKYNQSELLSLELSKLTKIAYAPDILLKTKNTTQQEGLSGNRRRKNVIGSFGVAEKHQQRLKNKRILLVDDVFTTGSTVDECAKVLKKHGAISVMVITLARVVLR
jgi:ComF family protein